jgi:hypothetical protein
MGQGQLRVMFDGDNDVILAIWPNGEPSASVEFCNAFNGGGKSPETRKALIALMCAMERDGAKTRPHDQATQPAVHVALKPCRSPYCECVVGACSHPGFYDARGE